MLHNAAFQGKQNRCQAQNSWSSQEWPEGNREAQRLCLSTDIFKSAVRNDKGWHGVSLGKMFPADVDRASLCHFLPLFVCLYKNKCLYRGILKEGLMKVCKAARELRICEKEEIIPSIYFKRWGKIISWASWSRPILLSTWLSTRKGLRGILSLTWSEGRERLRKWSELGRVWPSGSMFSLMAMEFSVWWAISNLFSLGMLSLWHMLFNLLVGRFSHSRILYENMATLLVSCAQRLPRWSFQDWGDMQLSVQTSTALVCFGPWCSFLCLLCQEWDVNTTLCPSSKGQWKFAFDLTKSYISQHNHRVSHTLFLSPPEIYIQDLRLCKI